MSSTDSEMVSLEGSPAEIGRVFGTVNGVDIRSEISGYSSGKSRDKLLKATETYRGIVERIAPHWLEEAAALARAAEVDAELYLAYQGAKYRGINTPECFTYFSPPRRNEVNQTLFHKNRDNRDRPQCAYVKGSRPGESLYRFVATGDTSDIGTMMGLNEKGLAAAADTGAPDPSPRYIGMMNPDLMRLILENASCVAESCKMLEDIHQQGIYAGAKVATNWMFADAAGKVARIVQYSDSLDFTHDQDDTLAMREDDLGNLVMGALGKAEGSVSPELMNRLSRTEPVLAKTNISAMTAVIPQSHPELFGRAQFTVYKADRTVYVPLYLGALATPRSLLDGSFYRRSKTTPPDWSPDTVETRLEARRSDVELSARAALASDGPGAAREVLTRGCRELAAIALGALSP